MKITKTSSWLELRNMYESSVGVDIPYVVERRETDEEIVWFGLNTNWKKTDLGLWFRLEKGEWFECNEPIYETLYSNSVYNNKPKLELQVGKVYNLGTKQTEPEKKLIVTEEQFKVIEYFAEVNIDKELNKTYKLGNCEFKVGIRINN